MRGATDKKKSFFLSRWRTELQGATPTASEENWVKSGRQIDPRQRGDSKRESGGKGDKRRDKDRKKKEEENEEDGN